MKFLRFVVLFVLFLAVFYAGYLHFSPTNLKKIIIPVSHNIEKTTNTPVVQTSAIFVPYWSLQNNSLGIYDSYIYFGITPNTNGIDITEPGFVGLIAFTKQTKDKKKILVLRLLDQNTINSMFSDSSLKQKVFQQTIAIAKQYNFSAVVIDLEYASLAFPSVTNDISSLITDFSYASKKQNLQTYVLIYGDTFYRARPFDIKTIAKQTDGIFVMAYDFHKASGNPGPNFPLYQGIDENYSFQTMITDFLMYVPKEKLTIIFGMFGYDWKVTDKGISLTQGQPVSTIDIEKSFILSCTQKNCSQTRNSAEEPKVTYIDSKEENHIIWYEDTTSMGKKVQYLDSKGIGNTAIWANSYF